MAQRAVLLGPKQGIAPAAAWAEPISHPPGACWAEPGDDRREAFARDHRLPYGGPQAPLRHAHRPWPELPGRTAAFSWRRRLARRVCLLGC